MVSAIILPCFLLTNLFPLHRIFTEVGNYHWCIYIFLSSLLLDLFIKFTKAERCHQKIQQFLLSTRENHHLPGRNQKHANFKLFLLHQKWHFPEKNKWTQSRPRRVPAECQTRITPDLGKQRPGENGSCNLNACTHPL